MFFSFFRPWRRRLFGTPTRQPFVRRPSRVTLELEDLESRTLMSSSPLITYQPVNQTDPTGSTATFTALATGSPNPTIQWQTSTNGGSTWSNIGGATSSSYSFTVRARANGSEYRALFVNSAGSATSSAATLTVGTATSTPPAITTQPASQTLSPGATATFTVAVSGSPNPTIQWQTSTDGGITFSDVSGATSASYSVPATLAASGQEFRAFVSNSAGAALSNVATLTVATLPTVTTQPTAQIVGAGASVTFTAAASGTPAPGVQWQSSADGTSWTNITGATSTSYTFNATAAQNGLQFRAVFSNAAGGSPSNAALLTVTAPPAVTTQPSPQAVTAGSSVTFTAAAGGSTGVQWQSSTDGNSWTNITGATSASYTFIATAAQNGLQFQAVFSNGYGSTATNAVALTILTVPVVTTQPVPVTTPGGTTATFTAAANGSTGVQWQTSTNGGSTWTNVSGATSATYSFTAKPRQNGNEFRAVFSNAAGSTTTSAATLTIGTAPTVSAPAVTSQPAAQTVTAGTTATFTAAASGTPTPTVQWQVSTNGGSTWSNVAANGNGSSYSLTATAGLTGEQFRAVFTSSAGTATSNAALLTVNTAPQIVTDLQGQTTAPGSGVSFTAVASGSPSPTVQWQVSTNGGSTWGNVTDPGDVTTGSDGSGNVTSTYAFTATAGQVGQQFRAVFTSAAGSATTSAAQLTVTAPPAITAQPSPQTATAGNSVTFTAAAGGSTGVQWQSSTDGNSWTNITGATSASYTFNATAAQNGLLFHAVFSNGYGSTATNAVALTVNTLPAVTIQPTPSQTVTAGGSVTLTAAASGSPAPTVQWQVSNDGTNWGNISGATSATYTFNATAAQNGEQFRALFTNAAGSTPSNAAALTVNSAPLVTTQPTAQAVTSGASVTFTAAASGGPAPAVKWQSSSDGTTWADVAGATSASYTFSATSAQNGLQFRAVFTNTFGSASSNAAALTVFTAPVVTTQPGSQTVAPGATATFTAAATGSTGVQWQSSSNGGSTWSNVSGATAATYSFAPTSRQSGNEYRAVFSNASGSTATGAATLLVGIAPAVSTQPVSQTANVGTTVTFTAAASGSPAPSTQWQVSVNGGTTWTNIGNATTGSTTVAVNPGVGGNEYRAVFTNRIGSVASAAATLTINGAPAITTQPLFQAVTAGASVTFTAAATGSTGVQWQVSTDGGASFTNVAGATSASYTFTSTAAQNGQQFRAVFSNSLGSTATVAAALVVNTLPVVTTQPVSQIVTAGASVTFTAAASGTPAPGVQWQSSADGTTWTNITGATSASYTFTSTAAQNGLQFRAVFTNAAGSVNSNAASLTVNSAPQIVTDLQGQTVSPGSGVSFTAVASGNPSPTVQWQVSTDGTTWGNITDPGDVTTGSDGSGNVTSTYAFTASQAQFGQQFRAVFTNSAGSATTSAAGLTVVPGPQVITNPQSQTVAVGTEVTFNAAASGGPGQTVHWQFSSDGTSWSNVPDPGDVVNTSNGGGDTLSSYTFQVTQAQAGEQFRAVFDNGAGGSATTGAATLTVPSSGPVGPPVTPSAADLKLTTTVGANGTSFTGTVSLAANQVSQYNPHVILQIDLNHDGQFTSTQETHFQDLYLNSSGTASFDVTGLIYGTYKIRIWSVDQNGNSIYSPVQTVTLQPASYGTMPVPFTQNVGQTDSSVLFMGQSSNSTVFLTHNSLVFNLLQHQTDDPTSPLVDVGQRVVFVGANLNDTAVGVGQLPGLANYYLGGTTETGVNTYQGVLLQNVWNGIDLHLYSLNGQIEYDFIVHPGASPSEIQLQFPDSKNANGQSTLNLTASGDLVMHPDGNDITFSAPAAYQQSAGTNNAVLSNYVQSGDSQYSVFVPQYNTGQDLIVDPSVFTSFVGGSGAETALQPANGVQPGPINTPLNSPAMTLDSSGNIYVVGTTASTDFPQVNQETLSILPTPATTKAIVFELSPDGKTLLFSTYLGGGGTDVGTAVALDNQGNIYVTGSTTSFGPTQLFPTTPGGFIPNGANNTYPTDAFVTELTTTGLITFSTFLGGGNNDTGTGIAVGSNGVVYVTGVTETPLLQPPALTAAQGTTTAFPVTRASFGNPQNTIPSGGPPNIGPGTPFVHSFLVGLSATPTHVDEQFGFLFGGNSADYATALALDSSNNVYVTGWTTSTNYPTLNGFINTFIGAEDGFVTKFNADGVPVYSTLLAGGQLKNPLFNVSNQSQAFGIAVDSTGAVYVTGRTNTNDFMQPASLGEGIPTGENPGPRAPGRQDDDAFLVKLGPSGNTLVYSNYLGSFSGNEEGTNVAVDQNGNAYVVGYWNGSNGFPLKNQLQTFVGGATDAFLAEFDPTGTQLLLNTSLGSNQADVATAVAVNNSTGSVVVAGVTANNASFSAGTGGTSTKIGVTGNTDFFVSQINPPTAASSGGSMTPGPTSTLAADLGTLTKGSRLSFQGLTTVRPSNGVFPHDWVKLNAGPGGTLTVTISGITVVAVGPNGTPSTTGALVLNVYQLVGGGFLQPLGQANSYGSTKATVTTTVAPGAEIYIEVFGYDFTQANFNLSVALS